ncbi:MAG: DMT family transporter [Muribaculaceae bacterium]|nr:DMT family transporter [Muribaculaceae bacterium]
MEYLLLVFLLGTLTPIQTAANSRLRQSVVSPLVASLVSFSIGTIFLFIATIIEKGTPLFGSDIFKSLPWWAWCGGTCGLYALTVNIIIFPKLGSVQTVLMPMLGQIGMGMLIDNFGLLGANTYPFSMHRLISLLLIIAGVIMVVVRKGSNKSSSVTLPWQILGISAGAVFAFQPTMNSCLAASLFSSIHAAFISFLTATILLLSMVMIIPYDRKHLPSVFLLDRPWWSWLGGIIGGIFVTGFAFFAPKVGVGLLLVTSICGMLTFSLAMDKYGWLGALKKRIGISQYVGLLLVVAGIVLLKI